MVAFLVFLILFFSNLCFSQSELEDSDFATPGASKEVSDNQRCELSDDQKLIELLDVQLRKFNPSPKDATDVGGAQMNPAEVQQNTIRFYNEQLIDREPVKLKIETFTSLGGDTLAALIERSSKILLKHPDKCEFFRLYGDQVIGSFEMSFQRILQLYASAVNKDNAIAQEFIRTQLVPSKMTVDDALMALYDDYGYQQNVIESLLPEDVRSLFFGENQVINIADVAESKLLAFSLLGGKITGEKDQLYLFAPDSKKGLLGSNETIVYSSSGKIYEVPLLNIPLALNVMRSLGFNAKIIILGHVYIDSSTYCKVGEGGMWYHYTGDNKRMGCDFLSNTIRSIKEKTLDLSEGYILFKESIDRVQDLQKNM
tara:strand:- start:1 stop:1110 length:1110 start_codon:yes stop_codon:yes gene_type:complete